MVKTNKPGLRARLIAAWSMTLCALMVAAQVPAQALTVAGARDAVTNGRADTVYFEKQASGAGFTGRTSGYETRIAADQVSFIVSQGQGVQGGVREHLARGSKPVRPQVLLQQLDMRFIGAASGAAVTPAQLKPGKSRYFTGGDTRAWRKDVAQYGQLRTTDAYPGIDIAYYGAGGQLEYDFVVSPGADPANIAWRYNDSAATAIAGNGDLAVTWQGAALTFKKPVAYQTIDGQRRDVPVAYQQAADGSLSFSLGGYDAAQALVIDPIVESSVLVFEGSHTQFASDADDNLYTVGTTSTGGAPSPNALLVTKRNAAGTLVYSTAIAGSEGFSYGSNIAVDGSGNVYVTGDTESPDFGGNSCTDCTIKPYMDSFAVKLDALGNLAYAKIFGGSSEDYASDIAVNTSGEVYVAGYIAYNHPSDATDSLSTTGVFQPAYGDRVGEFNGPGDGYIVKFAADGTLRAYTFLGGSSAETAWSIALDSSSNVYVAGTTSSADFPLLNPIYPALSNPTGGQDAFITKLNPGLTALGYSTYLGGGPIVFPEYTQIAYNFGSAIEVTGDGSAIVAGSTQSPHFPVTADGYDRTLGGGNDLQSDGFVARLNPAGNALDYSSYIGGSGAEEVRDMARDGRGNLYIGGFSSSSDLPLVNAFNKDNSDGYGGFLFKLNPTGSTNIFSGYTADGQVLSIATGAHKTFVLADQRFYTLNLELNTTTGTAVGTQPVDSTTGETPALLTFDSITSEGTTTLTTSTTAPALPGGYQLGNPPLYYDLETTATYSGSIQVCLSYDPAAYPDTSVLRVLHYENGAWVDITTSLDTVNHKVCGTTTSLSPFALVSRKAYTFNGFLAPFKQDEITVFKQGRTVPVKFTLTDASSGLPYGGADATLEVTKVASEVLGSSTPVETTADGSSTESNVFRYDLADEQYIYNLDTKGMSEGTYKLRALHDGKELGATTVSLKR
ncbi:MAG TPA: SBBP repeat-containing protein [Candidatus Saccharimonadales bacterium]|nr:SBBP repeat-containing protein [Candidatus Saccharimonadales bacterium]